MARGRVRTGWAVVVMALALSGPIQTTDVASGAVLRGQATWYAAASQGHAAAGRRLRRWLGPGWRNDVVRVRHNGKTIRVRLTDFCRCGHRLIDLSNEDFARLAPLRRGVITVRIRA